MLRGVHLASQGMVPLIQRLNRWAQAQPLAIEHTRLLCLCVEEFFTNFLKFGICAKTAYTATVNFEHSFNDFPFNLSFSALHKKSGKKPATSNSFRVSFECKGDMNHFVLFKINVSLVCKELTIRIEDTGSPFNPIEYYSQKRKKRSILGLHLIFSLVDSAHYFYQNSQNRLILKKHLPS